MLLYLVSTGLPSELSSFTLRLNINLAKVSCYSAIRGFYQQLSSSIVSSRVHFNVNAVIITFFYFYFFYLCLSRPHFQGLTANFSSVLAKKPKFRLIELLSPTVYAVFLRIICSYIQWSSGSWCNYRRWRLGLLIWCSVPHHFFVGVVERGKWQEAPILSKRLH